MQFDPFWLFRFPLSGNVAEKVSAPWFSPDLTFNYAGDPAVEEKVVNEVASYGQQIGWLNDVVLALAEKTELPPDVTRTVQRMTEAAKKIEAIKDANRRNARTAAIAALDRLKETQPKEYEELLRQRTSEVTGTPELARPNEVFHQERTIAVS